MRLRWSPTRLMRSCSFLRFSECYNISAGTKGITPWNDLGVRGCDLPFLSWYPSRGSSRTVRSNLVLEGGPRTTPAAVGRCPDADGGFFTTLPSTGRKEFRRERSWSTFLLLERGITVIILYPNPAPNNFTLRWTGGGARIASRKVRLTCKCKPCFAAAKK